MLERWFGITKAKIRKYLTISHNINSTIIKVHSEFKQTKNTLIQYSK